MSRRRLIILACVVAVAAFSLLATGCGGGGASPTTTATTTTENGAVREALAFARCMRSHGVPSWPDPTEQRRVRQVEAAAARGQLRHRSGRSRSVPAISRWAAAPRRSRSRGRSGRLPQGRARACAGTGSPTSPTRRSRTTTSRPTSRRASTRTPLVSRARRRRARSSSRRVCPTAVPTLRERTRHDTLLAASLILGPVVAGAAFALLAAGCGGGGGSAGVASVASSTTTATTTQSGLVAYLPLHALPRVAELPRPRQQRWDPEDPRRSRRGRQPEHVQGRADGMQPPAPEREPRAAGNGAAEGAPAARTRCRSPTACAAMAWLASPTRRRRAICRSRWSRLRASMCTHPQCSASCRSACRRRTARSRLRRSERRSTTPAADRPVAHDAPGSA